MKKSHQIAVQRSRILGQQFRQSTNRSNRRNQAQIDFNLKKTTAIGRYLQHQNQQCKSHSGLGTAAVGAGVGGVFGGPFGAVIGGAVGWALGKLS